MSTKLFDSVNAVLSRIPSFDAVIAVIAVWAFIRLIRVSRTRVRNTTLKGPPSPSFVYGVGKVLMQSNDPASHYASWAHQYGSVYAVPSTLGKRRIIVFDPKALAHFYARESWMYARGPLEKRVLGPSFGKGLFMAHGETHRRQRKFLSPGVNIAAVRKLTPIFYDFAYKAKGAWIDIIESSGKDSAIIDVQNWMSYISLDVIGIAGFSHEFGALDGKRASVTTLFDTFNASTISTAQIALGLLAQIFPILSDIPTARTRLMWNFDSVMKEISDALLSRMKMELEKGAVIEGEKSIIGQLIKSESAELETRLSEEEVIAQMKTLLVAGYETTAITLTWALIELARNPSIQTKLRNELLEHGSDPSYDQLQNGLLYLDAVAHEVLRVHAPVREITRTSLEDGILPLSEPICTVSGELIESVTVAKGTTVTVPVAALNRATAVWGEDAKEFRPSRWLCDEQGQNSIPSKAKELQGHRHLLTFSDGPRTCLGKNFAIAEFKAVLCVLVKHFVFEPHDGAEIKTEIVRGMLPRPRVVGEVGCKVPLRVKPYTG